MIKRQIILLDRGKLVKDPESFLDGDEALLIDDGGVSSIRAIRIEKDDESNVGSGVNVMLGANGRDNNYIDPIGYIGSVTVDGVVRRAYGTIGFGFGEERVYVVMIHSEGKILTCGTASCKWNINRFIENDDGETGHEEGGKCACTESLKLVYGSIDEDFPIDIAEDLKHAEYLVCKNYIKRTEETEETIDEEGFKGIVECGNLACVWNDCKDLRTKIPRKCSCTDGIDLNTGVGLEYLEGEPFEQDIVDPERMAKCSRFKFKPGHGKN